MAAEPADILARIADQRRERLAAVAPRTRDLSARPRRSTPLTAAESPLLAALERRRGRAVIAEVKMGSPRLGRLADRPAGESGSGLDARRQARLYATGGAAALSVVVEPDFFFGSYELLRRCREASGLPALAKDFVVDSRQIEWAAEAGAAAVLLIAALLDPEALRAFADRARGLGMVPLVECHDRQDLEKLGGAEWELVGINNRDLKTFEVSLERSIELLPLIPHGAFALAESGIRGAADLSLLAAAGFGGFLIGEALLLATDPAAKLAGLVATEGPPDSAGVGSGGAW